MESEFLAEPSFWNLEEIDFEVSKNSDKYTHLHRDVSYISVKYKDEISFSVSCTKNVILNFYSE